jgi:hypothetical protein
MIRVATVPAQSTLTGHPKNIRNNFTCVAELVWNDQSDNNKPYDFQNPNYLKSNNEPSEQLLEDLLEDFFMPKKVSKVFINFK